MTNHENGIGSENEFKYIMQDLYKLYFGVGCTYGEILDSDETYSRFKAVCRQYLLSEAGRDTTLESHLYSLTPEKETAEVFRTMGARVRLNVPVVKKGLFGREETVFREEIWKIGDFMALDAQEKKARGIVLSEIQIPKRGLRELVI